MGYIHCMFYQNCISIVHWRQVCESLYEVCILLYIQTNLPFLTSTHDSLSYPITPPVPTVQGGGGNSWHLSSPTSCTGGRGLMTSLLPDQLYGGRGLMTSLLPDQLCRRGEGELLTSLIPDQLYRGRGLITSLLPNRLISYRYHVYLKSTNIYIYANKRIYV